MIMQSNPIERVFTYPWAWNGSLSINGCIEKRGTFFTSNAYTCHRRMLGLPLLLSFLLFSSCTTAKINHFKNFSQAGAAYSDVVEVFLDEAGTAAIETDSLVLMKTRPQLTIEERKQTILEHNQLLRERLAILGDLKRHADLLRTYFQALAALAESDAPSGIGTATEGVVNALGKLHPKIKGAKIGERDVSSFVSSVTKIAVAHFQAGALEEELKERSQTIERELDLQQAALSAVIEGLRTDLQFQTQQVESKDVILPYVREGSLPKKWKQRRREALNAHFVLSSADAAADAAKELKISFVGLSEGRLTLVDIPALVNDMNEILTLMEKTKGKGENEK